MRTRSKRLVLVVAAVAAAAAAGCGAEESRPAGETTARSTTTTTTPSVALVEVGRFDSPVVAVPVPGTDLIAVAEQGGRVVVAAGMACDGVGRCPDEPVTTGDVVIDLRDEVTTGGERGLLGVAFHPSWPEDPRIFIDYTDVDGSTRIESWKLRTPNGTATRDVELLRIRQPYANHNGGHLEFGPDGLLYVGTGDGGSGGDPDDRAQEADDRLGKLLRLDVDGGGERGYRIPAGNLADGADEVWAVGLRNPWRFSFDAKTGDLWIGDVGQDTYEEIDAITKDRLSAGGTPNFGWRRFEGFHVFDDGGRTGPGELVKPVLEYGRDEGCSVTGGVVYRGRLAPELDGWYLFADFCADDLRLLRADGVPGGSFEAGELGWRSARGVERVASFATIQRNEVLVLSLDGSISQVVPA